MSQYMEELQKLRDLGLSYAQIGDLVGVNKGTIYYALHGNFRYKRTQPHFVYSKYLEKQRIRQRKPNGYIARRRDEETVC